MCRNYLHDNDLQSLYKNKKPRKYYLQGLCLALICSVILRIGHTGI